jgi:hypothetical protein
MQSPSPIDSQDTDEETNRILRVQAFAELEEHTKKQAEKIKTEAQKHREQQSEEDRLQDALEDAISTCCGLPISFGDVFGTIDAIKAALVHEASAAHDVYLGATVDVHGRWAGRYIRDKWAPGHRDGFDKMFVLALCYGKQGHRMESLLIQFGKDHFPDKLRNKSMLSSGLASEHNFVYVCTTRL